jgi:predicted dehydrogenase
MTIGIGILGLAHGHVGMYCGKWTKMSPEVVRVVGGWDHDRGRAEAAAKQHGFEVAETADVLLARTDIQAVVIGAETSFHADMVELAAAAKKTIVLQKPVALTLEQADRIVAAVERNSVPFTLAWQMRIDPQNIQMKELAHSGELGQLFQVRRRHCLSTHLWGEGFTNSWHVKPELNRGMWADDASHPIDWLLWMFGMPETVTAEIGTLYSPKIPDDNGIAIFRYANGMMAEISCSFTALAGENTTEILGANGLVLQSFGDLVSAASPRHPETPGLKWFLKDQKQWTVSDIPSPAVHGERIQALAGPLLEFMQEKRPPLATAREGKDALRLTLAAYKAAETGQRIHLKDFQN